MSIEIYIILSIFAAAVIGIMALPSRRGQARSFFSSGFLSCSASDYPSVEIQVLDKGQVKITRRGLPPLSDTSEVNLATEVIGFDVKINERIVGRTGSGTFNEAVFILDFFGRERYHIQYCADNFDGIVSFSLNIRPGIISEKPLLK